MDELKCCPFCGGKAAVRKSTWIAPEAGREYGHGSYFVMCDTCLTSGNNYGTEEKAIASWNRRVCDD